MAPLWATYGNFEQLFIPTSVHSGWRWQAILKHYRNMSKGRS